MMIALKDDYLYTPYSFLKKDAVIEWDERRLGCIAKQKLKVHGLAYPEDNEKENQGSVNDTF